MAIEYTTDEYGTKRATVEGWTFIIWIDGHVDCDGPNDAYIDAHGNDVSVHVADEHDESITVPLTVMAEVVRLASEAR